jgi:glycine betaine/proline transport system permease protein
MLAQSNVIPRIPLAEWIQSGVNWITENFDDFFDFLTDAIDGFVGALNFILLSPPELVMVAILTVIAFLLAGWRVALFTAAGLVFIISLGLWEEAMVTLALVLAATVICLIIGIPVGIVAAKNRTVEAAVRPILDFMQTMPAFVYLVPVVVLLSLGNPPAIIATVVFAMPPAVRLTMLGIQQVPKETVEAAQAFGATPWQTLLKVELPLSLRSIMAGVNQVIMLSLSMVVIAALAGAGGLGVPVLQGLGQLNVGLSFVGGVGIVIIAVILDRITRRTSLLEHYGSCWLTKEGR